MNAAVVRRTQDALGKVIRRPPLTEKLLSKPPFRYLHDIITEVIRMTGFMKGLYTDAEMKSDNVKDKDAKISFLQKAIDVVALVSGEPLSAKPARIVAGHEPERTNELLQRIGRCCLSQLSSDDAVKRVLAGEKGDVRGLAALTSKPQESDNGNTRAEEPRAPRDKEGRGASEVNERSASRDGKQREPKEESKPREQGRTKEKARENNRDRHKDPERDKGREGERERARARARPDRDRDRGNRDRDKDLDRERERRSEGGKDKERWRDRERERERDKGRDRDRDRRRAKNEEHARDPGREKSREQDKPDRKSSSSGEVSKKLSDGPFKDSNAETETEASPRAPGSMAAKTSRRRSRPLGEGLKEATASSARGSDGTSAGLWRDNPEPEPSVKQKGDSPSNAEGEVGPASQDKPQGPEDSEVPADLPADTRAGSGKTVSSVIVDARNSDDEDNQFVVEAAPQLPEVPEREGAQVAELEEDEKHGGLVTKILETKKDYEKLRLPPRPGEKEKSLVFESAWKKEKDIVSKEIEKLRVSIQTLCKSALPLGKIMDYLQEDVDTMQNELQLWRSESRQHAQALQREQSITDGAVEPLRAELAELEQLIRDQQDRICAVKAAILKNEEKIQKMVYGLNLSSRR